MVFGSSVLSALISGIILGLAYYEPHANMPVTNQLVKDYEGLFFLCNLNMFLMCLYATIMAFANETKVFMRENQVGANRVGSYYMAKMMTNWALEIFTPFLFGLIIWGLSGLQRTPEAFGIFILVTILNSLCFGSIGYCLAAMTADAQIAMAMGT